MTFPVASLGSIATKDLMWLAGLLEGEGSFYATTNYQGSRPRIYVGFVIQLGMKDRDVVERAAAIMGGNKAYYQIYQKGTSDRWVIRLTGKRAEQLVRLLYPHMGSRRKAQIRVALKKCRRLHGTLSS